MTVKPKRMKPVRMWCLKHAGKLLPFAGIYMTKGDALSDCYLRNLDELMYPVRVEIREVRGKR